MRRLGVGLPHIDAQGTVVSTFASFCLALGMLSVVFGCCVVKAVRFQVSVVEHIAYVQKQS